MDIHRCRFVPYNPKAINALAFSHPPSADIQGRGVPTLRLAIGRANGDIEIWNPLRGAWFQESILRGGKDRTVEGLVWTLDPSEDDDTSSRHGSKSPGKLRLFSIGFSSVVTEWDLETGRPARHSTGNYGEIWCLAAQPRWKATNKRAGDGKPLPPAEGEFAGQHLAVGCADGAIVILSTEDGDLRYLRTMRPSTKKSRVLSIAFQDRNTAVAGYADSSIRVFDIRNGRVLRTISVGKGPTKNSKELLVWSVSCLPDGTIVSGDSAGEVRFWDGRTYSLFQRIQGHLADVLDVAVSADGSSVVSAGADQRTVIYRLKEREKGADTRRWAELAHRRYHTHDVKALAVFETQEVSFVVSGGLDTVPVVVPLREYGKENHRKLSNLPQVPQLSSAPSSRLVMSWWDREVNLWRFLGTPDAEYEAVGDQKHKLVGKVLLQGEENLTAAVLSPDARLLVTATITQVKMFSLEQVNEDEGGVLRVHKLDIPQALSDTGAKALAISPDGQWLCLVGPNNDIYMAKITKPDDPENYPQILPTLAKLRRVPRREQNRQKLFHGSLGAYERTIHCIAFSGDSKILACGDVSGSIDTWILKENKPSAKISAKPKTNGHTAAGSSDEGEDSDCDSVLGGQSWEHPMGESALPRLKAGISLLSFRPLPKDDRLVVMTTTHELLEFSVLSGGLSEWSRRNTKEFMPQGFNAVKDRAMGALWDVSNGSDRLWLYGPSWLWMFDLSQDFPAGDGTTKQLTEGTGDEQTKPSNKRKRQADEERQHSKKINTGAGDRMPVSKSGIALGDRMRKVVGKSINEGEFIQINRQPQQVYTVDDDDDEDFSTANNRTLAQFRREREVLDLTDDVVDLTAEEADGDQVTQNGLESALDPDQPFAVVIDNRTTKDTQKPTATNQLQQTLKPDTDNNEQDPTPEQQEQEHNRRWWHTFKYREILGIVPLSADPKARLEVAVVERPLWDVTLPGRYVRDYE